LSTTVDLPSSFNSRFIGFPSALASSTHISRSWRQGTI
jgi:hypothetical protein